MVRGRGVREEECFLLEEDRGLGTGGSSWEGKSKQISEILRENHGLIASSEISDNFQDHNNSVKVFSSKSTGEEERKAV